MFKAHRLVLLLILAFLYEVSFIQANSAIPIFTFQGRIKLELMVFTMNGHRVNTFVLYCTRQSEMGR